MNIISDVVADVLTAETPLHMVWNRKSDVEFSSVSTENNVFTIF